MPGADGPRAAHSASTSGLGDFTGSRGCKLQFILFLITCEMQDGHGMMSRKFHRKSPTHDSIGCSTIFYIVLVFLFVYDMC